MDLNKFYEKRIADFESQYYQLKMKGRWIVISKLSFFILTFYFIYLWLIEKDPGWLIFVLTSSIVFAIIYAVDSKHLKKFNLVKNLIQINKDELNALSGNIQAFKNGAEFINHDHQYSFDLDIFGNGSLYQSVNRAETQEGQQKLAEWFQKTNNPAEEILARQKAVCELNPMIDFRQIYKGLGFQHKLDFTALSGQFEHQKYRVNKLSIIIYFIVSGATVTLTFLSIFDIVSYHIPLTLFFVQLIMVGTKGKLTNNRHKKLSGYYKTMNVYDDILKHLAIQGKHFQSEKLKQIYSELISGDRSAKEAFSQLKKLLARFDQRINLLITILTNGFLLNDLFLNARYEKCVNRYYEKFDGYKNSLGDLDALMSMASFSFNHPLFCFPEVDPTVIINAKEMGHPLIDANVLVYNDYDVYSQSSYHLVTGANMAGKSTFLRTVGVNLVLASNGAPVCAQTFKFKPMTLFSSMRTSDDLVNNVSYFQAELLRLKKLIETAKSNDITFIILDEILKGTNSKDKLSGSLLFLKKVLQYPASGIVATHDLALGEMANEFPDHFKNICFEIEIDGDNIRYDYKLQGGVATNLNATYLLQKMLMND